MLYFGFCPLLRSRSVTTTFSFYSFYSFYISPILSTNNFLKNQYNFVLCVFYSIPTIPLSKYLSSYSFMFWGFLKFLSMYLMATFLQYFPHLPLTAAGMKCSGVRSSVFIPRYRPNCGLPSPENRWNRYILYPLLWAGFFIFSFL